MTYDGQSHFTNQWTGNIRPKEVPRYYLDIPPVWQKNHVINNNNDISSSLCADFKLYIKAPTERFPTANLFLRVKNGKDSVLIRLIQPEIELKSLSNFIICQMDESSIALTSQKPLEEKLLLLRAQMNMLSQSQIMQQMQQLTGEQNDGYTTDR